MRVAERPVWKHEVSSVEDDGAGGVVHAAVDGVQRGRVRRVGP